MNIFRIRLKELRQEKGLSLVQLSKALNINDVAIGRWEKGLRVPNIIQLRNLAVYFKVSTDYLLGLTDELDAK